MKSVAILLVILFAATSVIAQQADTGKSRRRISTGNIRRWINSL